jgi:hypothetical protein
MLRESLMFLKERKEIRNCVPKLMVQTINFNHTTPNMKIYFEGAFNASMRLQMGVSRIILLFPFANEICFITKQYGMNSEICKYSVAKREYHNNPAEKRA